MSAPQAIPILSADEWRRLELVSTRGVDEFIRACAVDARTESLQNAIDAGCVYRGKPMDRLVSICHAFAEHGEVLAGVTRQWIELFAAGPREHDEQWQITPAIATDLLTKLMGQQVENLEEGSFGLVRMLVDLGIDPMFEKISGDVVTLKSPLQKAMEDMNVEALHFFLGEGRLYDENSPLPTIGAKKTSILIGAANLVREKGIDYRKGFDAIASHLAPGYTQPFEALFEAALYRADSLTANGEWTKSLIDIGTLIALGARPDAPHRWVELLGKHGMTTGAHDHSIQLAPLLHAMVAQVPDNVSPAMLRNLATHDALDLGLRDDAGATLLHRAVAHRRYEVVSELLALGADPTATAPHFDRDDRTRLMRPVEVLHLSRDIAENDGTLPEFQATEQKLNVAAAKRMIDRTVAASKLYAGEAP